MPTSPTSRISILACGAGPARGAVEAEVRARVAYYSLLERVVADWNKKVVASSEADHSDRPELVIVLPIEGLSDKLHKADLRRKIQSCDLIVLFSETAQSEEVAWKLGFAEANSKPVLLCCTEARTNMIWRDAQVFEMGTALDTECFDDSIAMNVSGYLEACVQVTCLR